MYTHIKYFQEAWFTLMDYDLCHVNPKVSLLQIFGSYRQITILPSYLEGEGVGDKCFLCSEKGSTYAVPSSAYV